MPIEVRCKCGKRLSVADKLGGKTGNCPYCGIEVRYPAAPSRTDRIIVAPTQTTARLEARLAVPARQAQDRDRLAKELRRNEQRRKLMLAGVLFLAASLILLGFYAWNSFSSKEALSESRQGLDALWLEAEAREARKELIAAFQLYRGVVKRGEYVLREVNTHDEEARKLVQEAKVRVAAIQASGELLRGRIKRDKPPPEVPDGSDEDPGGTPPVEPESPAGLSALEVVQQGAHLVYLDLQRLQVSTPFTVGGLGVLPDSPLDDFLAIWGEPAAQVEVPDEGLGRHRELWSFRAAHGFDLEVTPPTEESGGTIEKIVIHDNFQGSTEVFPIAGSVRKQWQRAYGLPARGSIPTLFRYTRPFAGLIVFDKQGNFREARINFQRQL